MLNWAKRTALLLIDESIIISQKYLITYLITEHAKGQNVILQSNYGEIRIYYLQRFDHQDDWRGKKTQHGDDKIPDVRDERWHGKNL